MSNVSFLRHNSFFAPDDAAGAYLNIIGVGATGSWVGLLAAKMGWHNFRIWDLDVVESHNCPNQIYDINQVGMKKVDAFEQCLKRFNADVIIEKYDVFFESEKHADLLDGIVFVAVDSLSARKDIVSCLRDNVDVDLILESAMGFTHAKVNAFSPFDDRYIDNYLANLKTDEEVQESACNARIITTLTTIVASDIVHTICNYFSASRRNISFNPKGIKLFSLDTLLTTYSLE